MNCPGPEPFGTPMIVHVDPIEPEFPTAPVTHTKPQPMAQAALHWAGCFYTVRDPSSWGSRKMVVVMATGCMQFWCGWHNVACVPAESD
jgi:hypothetical protein